MVVSWARTILSISKKAWTFPSRPYYYILSFPKINRKPNNNKTVGRKGHTGPRDSLEGESCLAGSFLIPAAPEGTYWAPGAAPCEEELPCRFLSRLMNLSRTGRIPAAPTTSLSLTVSRSLLNFMSIELVMLPSHLILWCPRKEETSLCQQRSISQSYGFSSSHVQMWELDHK